MIFDLAIVGAGPAGMRAAIAAARLGLSVKLVDEQRAPGGQIWRNVERRAGGAIGSILGRDYLLGQETVAAFRTCGCDYSPDTQLWNVETAEAGFRLFTISSGSTALLEARQLLLATGAQERPIPFPGWILPGVMTVGAAQIQLKSSGQIPERPVWIAGSGPLPLLYMTQLLAAGGRIAGYIDTTAPRQLGRAWPYLLTGAMQGGWAQLAKGAGWLRRLHSARIPVFRGGRVICAEGEGRLERLAFESPKSGRRTVETRLLLVHEGVIPSIHIASSIGCEMTWDEPGGYFSPRVDDWGETTIPGLFIAGDGARVTGAGAAAVQGERVALRIAQRLRPSHALKAEDRLLQRRLRRESALRPFLDSFYTLAPELLSPDDETIVCRCEEITAGEIRVAATGSSDPNQIKALTRCGMGPCQGRQCGPAVNRILAERERIGPAEVGLFRVRPPLKPISLGALAALQAGSGRNRA